VKLAGDHLSSRSDRAKGCWVSFVNPTCAISDRTSLNLCIRYRLSQLPTIQISVCRCRRSAQVIDWPNKVCSWWYKREVLIGFCVCVATFTINRKCPSTKGWASFLLQFCQSTRILAVAGYKFFMHSSFTCLPIWALIGAHCQIFKKTLALKRIKNTELREREKREKRLSQHNGVKCSLHTF
jgi:hypothetical protein